jgi:hypothetical protein
MRHCNASVTATLYIRLDLDSIFFVNKLPFHPMRIEEVCMPARLGVEHWRDRAEETLQLVELMTDEDSKWRVRRIAADYEKLAQRAVAANGASAAVHRQQQHTPLTRAGDCTA